MLYGFSSSINTNFAALKSFKVFVQKLPRDRTLRAGETVKVKILSIAYTKGVPELLGEFVSSTQASLIWGEKFT